MTLRTYESPSDYWMETMIQGLAEQIDRDILAALNLYRVWQ